MVRNSRSNLRFSLSIRILAFIGDSGDAWGTAVAAIEQSFLLAHRLFVETFFLHKVRFPE